MKAWVDTNNCQTEPEKICNKQNTVQTETNTCNDDEWSEDEAEIPAGVIDSILTPTDFLDDSEREQIHNVAPGEGNRSLSIFRDTYSDELAYPGIFLGQKKLEDKQRLVSAYYAVKYVKFVSLNWEDLTEGQLCVLKIFFSKLKNCKWRSC